MGITTAYARKLARQLETKKLLRRRVRIGTSNEFDLQPLFDVLAEQVETELAKIGN